MRLIFDIAFTSPDVDLSTIGYETILSAAGKSLLGLYTSLPNYQIYIMLKKKGYSIIDIYCTESGLSARPHVSYTVNELIQKYNDFKEEPYITFINDLKTLL